MQERVRSCASVGGGVKLGDASAARGEHPNIGAQILSSRGRMVLVGLMRPEQGGAISARWMKHTRSYQSSSTRLMKPSNMPPAPLMEARGGEECRRLVAGARCATLGRDMFRHIVTLAYARLFMPVCAYFPFRSTRRDCSDFQFFGATLRSVSLCPHASTPTPRIDPTRPMQPAGIEACAG
jgi:hypothetical protein